MPIQLFRKTEFVSDDVASSDPTVSCDVVAIIFPDGFETKIEEATYELPALLLKVVQSVDERQPAAEPLETVQSFARAPFRTYLEAVTVIPLVPETVPVAISPKRAGVPLFEVQ